MDPDKIEVDKPIRLFKEQNMPEKRPGKTYITGRASSSASPSGMETKDPKQSWLNFEKNCKLMDMKPANLSFINLIKTISGESL